MRVADGVGASVPAALFGARDYSMLDGGSGLDRYDTETNISIVTRGAETVDGFIEPSLI